MTSTNAFEGDGSPLPQTCLRTNMGKKAKGTSKTQHLIQVKKNKKKHGLVRDRQSKKTCISDGSRWRLTSVGHDEEAQPQRTKTPRKGEKKKTNKQPHKIWYRSISLSLCLPVSPSPIDPLPSSPPASSPAQVSPGGKKAPPSF
jgi:hypothetical protein